MSTLLSNLKNLIANNAESSHIIGHSRPEQMLFARGRLLRPEGCVATIRSRRVLLAFSFACRPIGPASQVRLDEITSISNLFCTGRENSLPHHI
jgi:hypothetical protein